MRFERRWVRRINASKITSWSITKARNQSHPTLQLKKGLMKNPWHRDNGLSVKQSLAFLDPLWGVTFDLLPWPDDLRGPRGGNAWLVFISVPTCDAKNTTARCFNPKHNNREMRRHSLDMFHGVYLFTFWWAADVNMFMWKWHVLMHALFPKIKRTALQNNGTTLL